MTLTSAYQNSAGKFLNKIKLDGLIGIHKARRRTFIVLSSAVSYASRATATLLSVMIGLLFSISLPESLISNNLLKTSETHLSAAGIIGTTPALTLSLSIIPAQKAADIFSPYILKIYAKDRRLRAIFLFLSFAVLISLFFGIGWTQILSQRYSLLIQLIILGMSLDALVIFYSRTLDLLVPTTALSLVFDECRRRTDRVEQEISRLWKIQRLTAENKVELLSFRWLIHCKTDLKKIINHWIIQLEEFGFKAVSRRDTHAASAVVQTITDITYNYAETRKGSLFLYPDLSHPFGGQTSDISDVLTPSYERISNICKAAIKQHDEKVVQSCLSCLGQLTVHAVSLLSASAQARESFLAYSPAYYQKLCVKEAVEANMEDALLTAVRSTVLIFQSIDKDGRTHGMESLVIDMLFLIAVSSYHRNKSVSGPLAIEAMLAGAQQEVVLRSYRDGGILDDVLHRIESLLPLEIEAERLGLRTMQPFFPYDQFSEMNIPRLILISIELVNLPAIESINSDPFSDFLSISERLIRHYRQVAEKNRFENTAISRNILKSIFRITRMHLDIISKNAEMPEAVLDKVVTKLRWLIPLPTFYFHSDRLSFSLADQVFDDYCILVMDLLVENRSEVAVECLKSMDYIIVKGSNGIAEEHYTAADLIAKLEILARAAEFLDFPDFSAQCRRGMEKPLDISAEKWESYSSTIKRRVSQMEQRLTERYREYHLHDDPVQKLLEIIDGSSQGSLKKSPSR